MLILIQFWLPSKQLNRAWEMRLFELVDVKSLQYVEYQSREKYCDDYTHQNSAFLHEGTESYESFIECRLAARRLGNSPQFDLSSVPTWKLRWN
jgi:hypothetical protein